MSYLLRLQVGRTIASEYKILMTKPNNLRHYSHKSPITERIAITDDGSTIVCWHPEKSFPYECSKPLPEELNKDTNSVLKVQNVSEIYDVFKPKTEVQTREELMKITSTSKHVWFPKGKKEYKKKPTPRDREYL